MEIMAHLECALAEITGMDLVTLQPAAGAHGESIVCVDKGEILQCVTLG